jgi:hypothetical protein
MSLAELRTRVSRVLAMSHSQQAYSSCPKSCHGIRRRLRGAIYRRVDQDLRRYRANVDNTAAFRHPAGADHGLGHIDYAEDIYCEFVFKLVLLDS